MANIPFLNNVALAGTLNVAGSTSLTGVATLLNDTYFNATTLWRVSPSDLATQRADARDDATTFSRLHWYGESDDGSTSNFRHAYYDGGGYIDVTASSGTLTFGGVIAATGGNSTEWNTAYDNTITGIAVSGTTTKTLTATQQDGGTLTTSWADNDNDTNWVDVGAGVRQNYTLGLRPPTNSYAGFYFQTETGTGGGYLLMRGGQGSGAYTDHGISLIADAGWLTLASRTTTDTGVRIQSGGDTRMTFLSGGNTGIGEESPLAKLHVKDAGGADGILIDSPSPNFYMQTAAAKVNWRVSAQENTDGGFEIGSSTTASGNAITGTYNQLFTIINTGTISFNTYNAGLLKVGANGVVSSATSGADLPGGPYLPLSGGTLTGDVIYSGGKSLIIDDSTVASQGMVRIPAPGGAALSLSGNTTGAIKIKLPVASFDNAIMMTFDVKIYDYTIRESVNLSISGYAYSSANWNNQTVIVHTTDPNRDYTVRFGTDSTGYCLWIAELASTWSYLKVGVFNFAGGHSLVEEEFASGWDITLVTSFDSVQDTISGNLPVAKSAALAPGYLPLSAGSSFPLTGDLTIQNTVPELVLTTTNGGWDENELISEIVSHVTDTSGIGARDVASIKVINDQTGASTTMSAAMAFYTSSYNANMGERMRIDNDGNVGIGTSSPSEILHTKSSGNNLRSQELNTGTSASPYASGIQFSNYLDLVRSAIYNLDQSQSNSGGNLSFTTATTAGVLTERMRINSAGEVLINATSSAYGHLDYGYNLGVKGTTNQAYMSIARDGQALGSQGMVLGLDTVYAYFTVRDNIGIQFGTANSLKMLINSGGNVSIGNSSNNYKLEVRDDSTWDVAHFRSDGTTGSGITMHSGNTGAMWSIITQGTAGGANDNNLGFHLTHAGTSGEALGYKVTMEAGGNVGIGTTAPTEKLHVAGSQLLTGGVATIDSSDALRVSNPGGASWGHQTVPTGAIKITLPQSWTDTMLRMTVRIYEYGADESFEVELGGYNNTGSGWINSFAHIISSASIDRNYTVRFGHDGTKCCIYIGELTDAWTYPQIAVTNFEAGFSNYTADKWVDGWDIGTVTSFGTITQTETNTQVTNWARNGSNVYYGSSTGNVLIGATSNGARNEKLYVSGEVRQESAIGPNPQGAVRGGLGCYDSTAMGINNGGQLVLGYKYSGSSYTEGAIIKMYKQNATNGQYGSGLRWHVRQHGEDLLAKMSLTPSGQLGIGTTSPSYKLDVIGTGGFQGNVRIHKSVSPTLELFDSTHSIISLIGDSGTFNVSNQNVGSVIFAKYDGNVGIATTAPTRKLQVEGSFYARGAEIGYNDLILKEVASAYSPELKFQNNTHILGIDYQNNETLRFITRSGAVTVPITFQVRAGTITATNFILSSDERLKENIKELEPKKIEANWKSFNAKNNKESYRTGVIAQELEVKHPEFVETNDEGFKSVKYIDLLISKIAELEDRIKNLEK